MAAAVVQLTNSKRRRFRDITVSVKPPPTSRPPCNFPHHSEPPNLRLPHPSHYMNSSMKGFNNFNSALTAGLLNPVSPPFEKSRSNPTLFEIMASEADPNSNSAARHVAPEDKQSLIFQRVSANLANRSPNSEFNDEFSGNVRLTLSTKDGIIVTVHLHRHILISSSRFFSGKIWPKQQRNSPYLLEISDCEDVEAYIEALRLMYAKNLKTNLMKEDVRTVLGIFKVCVGIGFDAGIFSCLEYLEAAPWEEEDEEKVTSLMSELNLEVVGAGEVLRRVSVDPLPRGEEHSDGADVLTKLMQLVIDGKDHKARR